MNTLQRRIHTLEANAEIEAYLCGAVIHEAQDKFYASLWRDYSGLVCCTHGEFYDTEAGAAAWLCSELAGMKSLAVFFIADQALVKMETYTGRKMLPAQVDQSLWEKANKNGVFAYV
jgi:hypothetical protein